MIRLRRDTIEEAEDQLLAAMKAHDIVVLDTLLHDDLLFITPDGQTITKAMDLEAHRSGSMVIDEIERTIETIHIMEDAAVITLTLDTKGSMLGQPIEGRFKYIRVWKLLAEQLKVIGGSCIKTS